MRKRVQRQRRAGRSDSPAAAFLTDRAPPVRMDIHLNVACLSPNHNTPAPESGSQRCDVMQRDTLANSNDQQISSRAYALWEQAGRPQGRGTEFWLQAEREIAREAETALPTGDNLQARPTPRSSVKKPPFRRAEAAHQFRPAPLACSESQRSQRKQDLAGSRSTTVTRQVSIRGASSQGRVEDARRSC
jgi:hypothetical protein